jgi:hypothetical protein
MKSEERQRCGAKTRAGTACRNWPVRGRKRCRLHGGAEGSGRPVIHGRYSRVAKAGLVEKFHEFLADPEYGSLKGEIAMERALFAAELERLEGKPASAADTAMLMGLLDTISKSIERLARIESRTALTAAELRLLEAVIVGILNELLTPGQVNLFVRRLEQALSLAEPMSIVEGTCLELGQSLE